MRQLEKLKASLTGQQGLVNYKHNATTPDVFSKHSYSLSEPLGK